MSQLTASEWIAIFSGIIALLAFIATAWQAHLTRKHNHLSSRPVLEIEVHCRADETIGIIIRNCGLGPAFIEDATATFRKTKYLLIRERELTAFISALVEAGLSLKEYKTAIATAAAVIPTGGTWPLLVLSDKDKREELGKKFSSLSNEIRLDINYKSLYELKYKAVHDWPVVKCA